MTNAHFMLLKTELGNMIISPYNLLVYSKGEPLAVPLYIDLVSIVPLSRVVRTREPTHKIMNVINGF